MMNAGLTVFESSNLATPWVDIRHEAIFWQDNSQ